MSPRSGGENAQIKPKINTELKKDKPPLISAKAWGRTEFAVAGRWFGVGKTVRKNHLMD